MCMCLHSLQLVKLNYGKKDQNPIDHVRFYKKDDQNTATKIDIEEVGVNVIPTKLFTTIGNVCNPHNYEFFRCHFCFPKILPNNNSDSIARQLTQNKRPERPSKTGARRKDVLWYILSALMSSKRK